MEMTDKTKVNRTGGSNITVIPSGISKLLNIEKGDTLIWNVKIDEKGATITVTPVKKK